MDSKIEPNPAPAQRPSSYDIIISTPAFHSERKLADAEDVLLSMTIDLATLQSVCSKLHHGRYDLADDRRLRIAAAMIKAATREMEHATRPASMKLFPESALS